MGKISFGDESEHAQIESLADNMVRSIAGDMSILGDRLTAIERNNAQIVLVFSNGGRLTILGQNLSAVIKSDFVSATTADNDHRRAEIESLDPTGSLRAAGEALLRGSPTDPADIPSIAESAAGLDQDEI